MKFIFGPGLHPSVSHSRVTSLQFSSIQNGTIYMLGKALVHSTPSVRHFPNIAFETVPVSVCLMIAFSHPFSRLLSAYSFHAFLLQAVNAVMSLALCPQVVSQAPQHLMPSTMEATCDCCFTSMSSTSA